MYGCAWNSTVSHKPIRTVVAIGQPQPLVTAVFLSLYRCPSNALTRDVEEGGRRGVQRV